MTRTARPVRVPPRRRPTVVAARALGSSLAVCLAVAGCGSGVGAQTNGERSVVAGASASAGSLRILNAHAVLPTAGGTALPLAFGVSNGGAQDDTLTAVTAAVATGSTLPAAGLPVPGGGLLAVGSAGQPMVALTGLTTLPSPGTTIPVTLTFAKGGQITVALAVEADPAALATANPSSTGSAPAASTSATASP